MDFALNTLKESVTAISEAKVDAGLRDSIVRMANQHKVLPELQDIPFVRSPLLEILEKSYSAHSTGMTHVLYAEPSTGKTSACRIFVENVMRKNKGPALMVSGQAVDHDYFSHVATRLGAKKAGWDWVASLVAALIPSPTSLDRPHAVLILDEFNDEGPDCINMKIAEALFRQIYNNHFGFTTIFVTQNKKIADTLCAMNKWQKIGPLPGLTRPNRWEAAASTPPDPVPWIPVTWTAERLTIMILLRFPGKFDGEVVDKVLPWLAGTPTPTIAIEKAIQNLDKRFGPPASANDLP